MSLKPLKNHFKESLLFVGFSLIFMKWNACPARMNALHVGPTDQVKFISCVVTSPWLEPKTKQNNRVLLGSCKARNVMEIHKSKIQWSWLQLSVDGRPLHWSGGSSSSRILFQFASLRPRPLLHECFSSASHYNHHDSHIKFEISPFLL